MESKNLLFTILSICVLLTHGCMPSQKVDTSEPHIVNPLIHADVPDMSMIRVGETYYMSSTTMHMSPGVPIMESKDLTNWKLINYCYDTLADVDALNLENDKNAYGRGSWASCMRYHNGTFYISTFAATTGLTYIFKTKDIYSDQWDVHKFEPSLHDNTIFFDDDGKIYIIWGNGKLMIAEIKSDLSGLVEGSTKVLMENASAPAGDNIMLGAEGSQLFKVNGKYYLFNITWPRGGMRTVLIYKSDSIQGPYEGQVALQDRGIAQGGLIDTPEGDWYAYLFRDYGAVGRIPYIAPVKWEEEWPVIGIEGIIPDTLNLPKKESLIPGIAHSDEFDREPGEKDLSLVWQWNHNPVNQLWSLSDRPGHLRLTTGRVDEDITKARNTLTQRTLGPVSTGVTSLDISGLKEGDFAGLTLLQRNYGNVGVKIKDGKKFLVMESVQNDSFSVKEEIEINQNTVYLKAECDFTERKDVAEFYYSLDNEQWNKIGDQLFMRYTLPHFMGYRFGLFYFSTKEPGGFADFDFFRISDTISAPIDKKDKNL